MSVHTIIVLILFVLLVHTRETIRSKEHNTESTLSTRIFSFILLCLFLVVDNMLVLENLFHKFEPDLKKKKSKKQLEAILIV